jgi:hypothetical protein
LDWDGWVKIGISLLQTKPNFSFRLLSLKHLEMFLWCAEMFLATVMLKYFNDIPPLLIWLLYEKLVSDHKFKPKEVKITKFLSGLPHFPTSDRLIL